MAAALSRRRRITLIFVAAVITASCSEKPRLDRTKNSNAEEAKPTRQAIRTQEQANQSEIARSTAPEAERENERQPQEDEIGEDCVAFLRATKVIPAQRANADCPDCPDVAEAKEVLTFQQFQTDRISCSATTCEVAVTIRAIFNPGPGGEITGGLTAWISPEQRTAYLRGDTPPGPQVFRVKVTYKRNGKGWRAIEFDTADPQ